MHKRHHCNVVIWFVLVSNLPRIHLKCALQSRNSVVETKQSKYFNVNGLHALLSPEVKWKKQQKSWSSGTRCRRKGTPPKRPWKDDLKKHLAKITRARNNTLHKHGRPLIHERAWDAAQFERRQGTISGVSLAVIRGAVCDVHGYVYYYAFDLAER